MNVDSKHAIWLKAVFCFALVIGQVGLDSFAQQNTFNGSAPLLSLEAIHASDEFVAKSFQGWKWAEKGSVLYIKEVNRETQTSTISSIDFRLKRKNKLISESSLQIDDFSFSDDGTLALLFTDAEYVWRARTQGFYYLLNLKNNQLTPLSDRRKGLQMSAKLSPDGTKAAFVRNRNLFVVDLKTGQERALTFDGGSGGVINGTFDWLYEEEFGMRNGWKWSPDSEWISFYKLDESRTSTYSLSNGRQFHYPRAGEVNPTIRIDLIHLETGRHRSLHSDTWCIKEDDCSGESEYLTGMDWVKTSDGKLKIGFMRLNRAQNRIDVLLADTQGVVETVLSEKDDAWIEVDGSKLTFLDDGRHFIWVSERSGFRHLYLYTLGGKLVSQITEGEWDVAHVYGVNPTQSTVYFSGTLDSALERHIYSTPLVATSESRDVPKRISRGKGVHAAFWSGDKRFFLNRFSNSSTPEQWQLFDSKGMPLAMLENNVELQARLFENKVMSPEAQLVRGADGTKLWTSLIKPTRFDSTRMYPLLLYVYGGPGSQTVVDAYGGTRFLWHHYLANELNMIIAFVDNRGTGGRGKEFKKSTHLQLGQIEAADQIAVARHLSRLSYIDSTRVGVWGWSFGGYMTLMCMLTDEGPSTFKMGISVAPVTDWRLYDTVYSERYLSTPQENAIGYERSSPQFYVDRMKETQKLLLIHGDMDDNVHVEHTLEMARELQNANKQFEMMIYPGKNHNISGGITRLNLFQKITDFIKANL